jgi:hypothetical protein
LHHPRSPVFCLQESSMMFVGLISASHVSIHVATIL